MQEHGTLSSLPLEVLIDNILILLPPHDLLALGATDRQFHALCNDDVLWRRKLIEDFNYPLAVNARTSGFQYLYQGMRRPKVYVWGSVENGRLGLGSAQIHDSANRSFNGVPYPVESKELSNKGVRIVQLSAGGWSFHALDSDGNLWVWGQLDGEGFAFQSDAFSDPAKRAVIPHRLVLPVPLRSISSGRNHSAALDSKSRVWGFRSWGRPYTIESQFGGDTVIQVECGWDFAAALTDSGDVYVWWPGHGEMKRLITENDTRLAQQRPQASSGRGNVIQSSHWELHSDPLVLPVLPRLPDLHGNDRGRLPGDTEDVKIIQVAGGQDYLVALTNRNHVLKIDLSGGAQDDGFQVLRNFFSRGTRWEYLPLFTEGPRVAQLPAFASAESSHKVPDDMRITHVSANYTTFVAYSSGSSSIVLMGDNSFTPEKEPKVIPSLQHRSIISVVLGDYHRAALTSSGELLTWGAFSSGALGLGDPYTIEPGQTGGFPDAATRDRAQRARLAPPEVTEPATVRFDHGDKRPRSKFCFAAAASGWHLGALVIDLDEEEESLNQVEEHAEKDDEHDSDAGPSMPGRFDGPQSGHQRRDPPPFVRDRLTNPDNNMLGDPNHIMTQGFQGIRIGYAARGAMRGGGFGRGLPPNPQG